MKRLCGNRETTEMEKNSTLAIILRHPVDLMLFAIFLVALIYGLPNKEIDLLGGALLLAIGYSLFNFINKIIAIKKGLL